MAVRVETAPLRLRSSRPRYGELVVKGLLGLCALISVLTTVGIIAALFIPGSSIIVSDNRLSDETGEYTEFIVLTP